MRDRAPVPDLSRSIGIEPAKLAEEVPHLGRIRTERRRGRLALRAERDRSAVARAHHRGDGDPSPGRVVAAAPNRVHQPLAGEVEALHPLVVGRARDVGMVALHEGAIGGLDGPHTR